MSDSQDPYQLQELERRQQAALAMGGETKVAIQHSKARMTARERIDSLVDTDSFDEYGQLNHSERSEAQDVTPADGKIAGYGRIASREVYVTADDVTVMAGAGGAVGMKKAWKAKQYAIEKGLPIINLGEAGGARMPDILGATGLMSVNWPIDEEPRNRRVPMIAAIMGDCFGLPSWNAAMADVVIQVKGAIYAVGGSSIISVATGEAVTDDELGGWELHAHTTGTVDLFAENDQHCLQLIRQVLSYFPSSSQDLPPVVHCEDDPDARLESVFDLVPADLKQPYDMHALLDLIADQGSIMELKPYYDGSLITALIRLNGQVTGVLANNPMVSAGAMGYGACEKAVSFISLCDSFHIPLLFLHDTPGFLLCREAEQHKMPVQIMRFIEALQRSTVPRVSLILRKSYGMAHYNMAGANMLSDMMLAWPTADISFMAPEVAVNVIYGRKLQEAENADALREQYLDELHQGSAPWGAAGQNYIDKIIDPRDTRRQLIRAFARARGNNGEAGRSKRQLAHWPKIC